MGETQDEPETARYVRKQENAPSTHPLPTQLTSHQKMIGASHKGTGANLKELLLAPHGFV